MHSCKLSAKPLNLGTDSKWKYENKYCKESENFTTAVLKDGAEGVMVNLKNVPKPDNIWMNQGLVYVIFTNSMAYVTLFLFFTPLSI